MSIKINVIWDVTLYSLANTRAIQQVTSNELLTKQPMREKNAIIYKKYANT
jgi:hypothetical protein